LKRLVAEILLVEIFKMIKKEFELLDAMKVIDDHIAPIGESEKVFIFDAAGRVLAESILCQKELPAFTNSGMDGYAIRLGDSGKKVKIVGSIFAGDDVSDIEINDGECYKIMTGAMCPKNSEAVVPFEDAISTQGEFVELPQNIKPNHNIKLKGEELALGKTVLQKGERLNASALSLIASQGISVVEVLRSIKIGVLSTGDEIVEPWHKAEDHQIYNSNSSAVYSHLKLLGFDVSYIGILPDELSGMKEKIRALQEFDVVFTTGGVSKGEADFVEKAFKECGMDVIFHGVLVKPGRHTMMGKTGKTYIFGLPGNPLAATVNLMYIIAPFLFKLSGEKSYYADFVYAKNMQTFKLSKGRANMVLGTLRNGEFLVARNGKYGSGMITPLVESNAIIFTKNGLEEVREGEMIKVVPMNYSPCRNFADMINA